MSNGSWRRASIRILHGILGSRHRHASTRFRRSCSGKDMATARNLARAQRSLQPKRHTKNPRPQQSLPLPNATQLFQVKHATRRLNGRCTTAYVFTLIGTLGLTSGRACKISSSCCSSRAVMFVRGLALKAATLRSQVMFATKVSSGRNKRESIRILNGTLGSLLLRASKISRSCCSERATLVVQDHVQLELYATPETMLTTMSLIAASCCRVFPKCRHFCCTSQHVALLLYSR